jgi:rubrerythrin
MKIFSRNAEDFVCENCGFKVQGNGFTNHCPKCFYSKHVDINPGDRMCKCQGLMEPIAILQKRGNFIIQHKCKKCGFIRNNTISEDDDRDALFRIAKKLADEAGEKF